MKSYSLQSQIAEFAKYIPLLVTLFVTTGINIDPVNLPKMALLTVVAGYLFGLIVSDKFEGLRKKPLILVNLVLMLSALILSTLLSKSPLIQVFYGSYGRNTGLLTYISLLILFSSFLYFNSDRNFEFVLITLAIAGGLNTIYGLLQLLNLDPVDWNNNFNAIIGTLGNPNFACAIISISLLTYPFIFQKYNTTWLRIVLIISLILSIYAILRTKSQQGFIYLAIGGSTILLYYLYKKKTNKIIGHVVASMAFAGLITSVLGILQIGPLARYLYQPSVSLRGFYWRAGISMFDASPIFGNGLDTYGDLYTRFRSPQSVLSPGGPNVFSNASHNVFIDMAASGGLILLLPYLVLNVYVIYISLKALTKCQFDWVLISAFACWLAFTIQTFISINQIGLAVWVWSLPGLLIARANQILMNSESKSSNIKRLVGVSKKRLNPSAFLIVSLSTVLSLLFALPEQLADMRFKSSMFSRSIEKVEKVVLNLPLSSERLSRASQVFLQNGLYDEALLFTRKAIIFNPNHLNSWITLINNPKASKEEILMGKTNLIRLDPLNQEWKNIKI